MTDHPDIVARLRAYTQHNRPVLASDLKEAADELQTRQHLVDQFARLLRHLFEGVHEAVGSTTVPPINTQTSVELVGTVSEVRRMLDDARRSLAIADERSSILVDLVRSVSNAAGRKVAPNAFDRADLQHLVDDVAALRRDRDALMPADLPEDAEAPPAVTPSTERFDEFERRLALLESSARLTARRFDAAKTTMIDCYRHRASAAVIAASLADALEIKDA